MADSIQMTERKDEIEEEEVEEEEEEEGGCLPLTDNFNELLNDFETFEPIPDLEFSFEDPFRILSSC